MQSLNTDKQHITLLLDEQRVALNVRREKEPVYRDAAAMLNRLFRKFMKMDPAASVEKLWMYVALEVAVNLHDDAREKNLQPVNSKLEEMNRLIEEALADSSAQEYKIQS